MARVEEINNIPADSVDEVVRSFKSQGAEVEVIEQGDGTYTVRATFQD